MAAFFADDISGAFSWIKILYFYLNFIEVIPKGPNNNKSVLVQVMARHRTGDKPLSEPVLTLFADVYATQREDGFNLRPRANSASESK